MCKLGALRRCSQPEQTPCLPECFPTRILPAGPKKLPVELDGTTGILQPGCIDLVQSSASEAHYCQRAAHYQLVGTVRSEELSDIQIFKYIYYRKLWSSASRKHLLQSDKLFIVNNLFSSTTQQQKDSFFLPSMHIGFFCQQWGNTQNKYINIGDFFVCLFDFVFSPLPTCSLETGIMQKCISIAVSFQPRELNREISSGHIPWHAFQQECILQSSKYQK